MRRPSASCVRAGRAHVRFLLPVFPAASLPEHTSLLQSLRQRPKQAVVQLSGSSERLGILHGDVNSLAGWEFDIENLAALDAGAGAGAGDDAKAAASAANAASAAGEEEEASGSGQGAFSSRPEHRLSSAAQMTDYFRQAE